MSSTNSSFFNNPSHLTHSANMQSAHALPLSPELHTFYNKKRVLVTGGCGFIGSHLAEKLVELGARVTIVDNLSTGTLENIKHIQHQVSFLEYDITNSAHCVAAVKNNHIIFHLAAFISVPESIEKPQACFDININGTNNLLEAARLHRTHTFVFSSSAAVYGPISGLCSETLHCNPTSPYGTSKRIGELLCMQYRTNYNLATVALRYFNVWGARQNPHGPYAGAMARFSYNMEHNLPITIFGDGSQTRDFIPVAQVVEANLNLGMRAAYFMPTNLTSKSHTLANSQIINRATNSSLSSSTDTSNPYSRDPIFNIATGKSISLLKLLDQLRKQYPHYTNTISFLPARPGDIQHSSANIKAYLAALEQAQVAPQTVTKKQLALQQ
jgi:UDP-glucose 4-epimerase